MDEALATKIEYYNSIYNVKMTTERFPDSNNTLRNCKVPLGAVIQPFMNLDAPQYTENNPIRCDKCHCFLNPFWDFLGKGDTAKCNLCPNIVAIPKEHYQPLNEYMLPINYEDRPELNNGVFEMRVNEDFTNKPPSFPKYLFLVDVTPEAIASGATHAFFASLQSAVQEKLLNGGENVSVGIVCFDSKIHLINMDSTTTKPIITSMVGAFDTCPFPISMIMFSPDDFLDDE